jgi:hypothetical protein
MQRQKESFIKQAAGSVAALWPWIGKHQVKNGNRIRRQKPLDRVGNLNPQNPGVRQARSLDLSTGSANAAKQTLDSKKIAAGILDRNRTEKCSVATTEINFERRDPAENSHQVEDLGTICRDELDLAC